MGSGAAAPETEVTFESAFELALDEAVRSSEVRLVQKRPSDDKLVADARQWRGAVHRRTASEEAAYRRALAERQELEARKQSYNNWNWLLTIFAVLGVFLIGVVVYELWVYSAPAVALVVTAAVVIFAALLVPRSDEDRERWLAWRAALRIAVWSARDGERLSAAANGVRATLDIWIATLGAAILARLLGHLPSRPFSVRLQAPPAGRLPAGLRESLDTSFHVQTETGRKLARLIRDLGGGSFALVGARGTGKTDLLGALAMGVYEADGAAPALTVFTRAPVRYVAREFVLQLFADTCSETIDVISVYLAEPNLPAALAADLRALMTQAEEKRQSVLHQQTISLEGAITGGVQPVTLGVRRSVSRTRLAYTYPELVSQLHRFLAEAESVLHRFSEHPPVGHEERGGGVAVVVAIDELDRMESAEQARAFLHEVKAVFGVRNCCFIVAMAEEALESFDAAGKPLYDVMDRAFDQIVHMAYVDLATCGSLLASRAGPRFAEPFVGLCYCLAGGVPRNVIRVARDVVGTALRLRRDRLSEITGEIVSSEIRATVNWARARLAGIDARDASAMVRALDAWAHSRPPDEPLRDRLLDLAALPAGPGDAIEIRSVRNRILTTAYFLLTIVDVFGDDLDEARYARGKREDPPGGSLESLARAHRRLGANDRLAREMIVRFREVWCLPELPGGEPA